LRSLLSGECTHHLREDKLVKSERLGLRAIRVKAGEIPSRLAAKNIKLHHEPGYTAASSGRHPANPGSVHIQI
jgi:hypothetical protein